MLAACTFGATIPSSDLQRSRQFYELVLGLVPERDLEAEVVYRAGNSLLDVYPSPHAGSASHTLGSFVVDDIRAMVDELRLRGVTFEDYDDPGLRTDDGIAQLGPDKVAWFKDPDGNLLSLTQEDAKG